MPHYHALTATLWIDRGMTEFQSMRRSTRIAYLLGALVLLCAAAYLVMKLSSQTNGAEDDTHHAKTADQTSLAKPEQADNDGPESQPAHLPDTPPPPGLSINAWSTRDCFPVIRKPWYVSAGLGDTLLAPDEPVLGLVLGNEIRAYSTNQLNEHEMVLDDIAGTPVLVTY
jgi:Protein of unknown function (DUF3179)